VPEHHAPALLPREFLKLRGDSLADATKPFDSARFPDSDTYITAQGFGSFSNHDDGIRFAFPMLSAKVRRELLDLIRDLGNENGVRFRSKTGVERDPSGMASMTSTTITR
jgi:hypothetical protein